jgi:hypothetical protein
MSMLPVPGEGLEPPTFGLQNRCTTTVLTRREARQQPKTFGKPTVEVPSENISDISRLFQAFTCGLRGSGANAEWCSLRLVRRARLGTEKYRLEESSKFLGAGWFDPIRDL